MKGMGVRASELPDFKCCMYPIQFGTMDDEERKGYLIGMGETAGGRELVTLCGGCDEAFGMVGVESEHLIAFLHRRLSALPKVPVPLRVSVEPGCAAIGLSEDMLDVVRAMGCIPVGNEPGCCGKGNRNVGAPLMAERQEAAKDADVIVVGCPMCQKQYGWEAVDAHRRAHGLGLRRFRVSEEAHHPRPRNLTGTGRGNSHADRIL